jgi:beta-galactosidase/beta-glucuronidase
VDRDRLVVWRLPGDWRFRTDPRDEGVRADWASAGHSTADWCPIKVGEGYGWERQGFEGYTGLGWYRITGTVPADVARRHVYLYFEAVDEDAVVFINGRRVFEHTCDSTGLAPEQIWVRPFAFEPGDYAAPGQETTLAVRVLNRMGMGGVYKPVYVVGSDQELDAGLIAELLSGRE